MGWRRPRHPVLGMIASGEVHALVADVTGFTVSQSVVGFDRRIMGAYAQYVS